jgi:HPt (histidine-containing phosphotransfer) domain-containing protein
MADDNVFYNLSQIEAIASGNQEFIDKMVTMFLDLTPDLIARIDSGIAAEDWDEVKAAAHKMKPSIDMMGIDSLHSVVREVEDRAKNRRELDSISQPFNELKTTLESVFQQLRNR